MSHVVKLSTKFKDIPTLQKVCDLKKIPIVVAQEGKTLTRKLYNTDVQGVAALDLPGWQYPVVVAQDGESKADNYGGSWGDQKHLDDLSKDYAREVVSSRLRSQGFRQQSERVEEDGTVELVFVS